MKIKLRRPTPPKPLADPPKDGPARKEQPPKLDRASAMQLVHEFLDAARKHDTPGRLGAFLVHKHLEVFGRPCPSAPLALLKAKIAYRLQYVGMKTHGFPVTPEFMQNYQAAQALNLEGFDPDSKSVLEIRGQSGKPTEGDSEIMKIKKKAAVAAKKEKVKVERPEGLSWAKSVRATMKKLLDDNRSAKLTDDQLLKKLHAAHPEKAKQKSYKSAGIIASHRKGYNERLPKGAAESVAYTK